MIFDGDSKQLKLGFRGKKGFIEHYPNLRHVIERVIKKYKYADCQFKTETLLVCMTSKLIRGSCYEL